MADLKESTPRQLVEEELGRKNFNFCEECAPYADAAEAVILNLQEKVVSDWDRAGILVVLSLTEQLLQSDDRPMIGGHLYGKQGMLAYVIKTLRKRGWNEVKEEIPPQQ